MARAPRPETLILDLETVPDSSRWQRPEPPPSAEGAPPPPRRDDVFPPIWAHRVIVVGRLQLDHGYRLRRLDVLTGPQTLIATSDDERERELLRALSRDLDRERPLLVTYNGRAFDLPVIAMRALCHAVPIGWYYKDRDVRSRYSGNGHLDLCDWLADHGAIRAGKLDQIARLIGLPGKVGIDGSQVADLYARGELAAIERYCLADCAQTALLFLRFQLVRGVLSPEDYRDAVDALLDGLAADGRVVLEGPDGPRGRGGGVPI